MCVCVGGGGGGGGVLYFPDRIIVHMMEYTVHVYLSGIHESSPCSWAPNTSII